MITIPRGYILLPHSAENIFELANAHSIVMSPGSAKAISYEELSTKGYYGGVREALISKLGRDLAPGDEAHASKDFDTALEQRLDWAVANKEINKGQFDDRKLRFANYASISNVIRLWFGPSHFEEHAASNIKSINDLDFRQTLLEKGVKNYNDKFAYFAGNLALNCVVLTTETDGSQRILLGKRSAQQRLYPGFWHNIGGFADSKDILPLLKSNNSPGVRNAFQNAMKKELLEEAAIAESDLVSIREIGVSYGWSSFDINYLAKVTSPADYICTKGHFKGKDKEEHSGFISTDFGGLVDVLEGKKVFTLQGVKPSEGTPSDIVPIGLGGMLIYVGMQDMDALTRVLSSPQYACLGK